MVLEGHGEGWEGEIKVNQRRKKELSLSFSSTRSPVRHYSLPFLLSVVSLSSSRLFQVHSEGSEGGEKRRGSGQCCGGRSGDVRQQRLQKERESARREKSKREDESGGREGAGKTGGEARGTWRRVAIVNPPFKLTQMRARLHSWVLVGQGRRDAGIYNCSRVV